MTNNSRIESYGADQLRRFDKDRYLTAMFALSPVRDDLIALYAFNLEVSRIAEIVSEPMIGEIRLQWWREALDGIYSAAPRKHEVVEALSAAIARHNLPRILLDRLIDARVHDLDDTPPATLEDLIDYAQATGSTLVELAVHITGAGNHPAAIAAAQHVGLSWSLTGILRAIPFHASRGRVLLPLDMMAASKLDPHDILHGRTVPGLREIVREIHFKAAEALQKGRALRADTPQTAAPAFLVATLGAGYLKALAKAGYDPFAVNYERGAGLRHAALMLRGLLGRW